VSATPFVLKRAPKRKMPLRKPGEEVAPMLPYLHFDCVAGRGGMSTVWKAFHTELKKTVAVKIMNKEFATSKEDVGQFLEEVHAMTAIHHPGIVRGYGAYKALGRYYFIMDFVGGYTFGSLITRKGHVGQTDALIVCASVAEALGYAWDKHRVVHFDIKPENLMVDTDGRVKITDLGLCRCGAVESAPTELSNEIIGTPAYMSPEQICGAPVPDFRSDIYSLGATLYHMVTGRLLFPDVSNDETLRLQVEADGVAPDPRTFNPALSAGFARLLARMCAKHPDDRYATWEDVARDARTVDAGGELPPLPDGFVTSVAWNK